MSQTRTGALSLALTVPLMLALPMTVAAAEEDDLAAARAGTEGYADVAATEADGYGLPPEGPLHECIESLDDTGAMGLHYINGDLVGDTVLDPATPEALVYEPAADGTLTLVALEYVVFAEAWDEANAAPPMLFEQIFMLTEAPNRYELPAFYALHVWLWKENPSGLYAGFNPNVTCTPREAVPNTAVQTPVGNRPMGLIGLTLMVAAVAFGRRALKRSA